MKLWKVLARTSHVYTSHAVKNAQLEMYEFKSRSPTFSDDSGKHSGDGSHQGVFLATVQLRRRTGESLGIILGPESLSDEVSEVIEVNKSENKRCMMWRINSAPEIACDSTFTPEVIEYNIYNRNNNDNKSAIIKSPFITSDAEIELGRLDLNVVSLLTVSEEESEKFGESCDKVENKVSKKICTNMNNQDVEEMKSKILEQVNEEIDVDNHDVEEMKSKDADNQNAIKCISFNQTQEVDIEDKYTVYETVSSVLNVQSYDDTESLETSEDCQSFRNLLNYKNESANVSVCENIEFPIKFDESKMRNLQENKPKNNEICTNDIISNNETIVKGMDRKVNSIVRKWINSKKLSMEYSSKANSNISETTHENDIKSEDTDVHNDLIQFSSVEVGNPPSSKANSNISETTHENDIKSLDTDVHNDSIQCSSVEVDKRRDSNSDCSLALLTVTEKKSKFTTSKDGLLISCSSTALLSNKHSQFEEKPAIKFEHQTLHNDEPSLANQTIFRGIEMQSSASLTHQTKTGYEETKLDPNRYNKPLIGINWDQKVLHREKILSSSRRSYQEIPNYTKNLARPFTSNQQIFNNEDTLPSPLKSHQQISRSEEKSKIISKYYKHKISTEQCPYLPSMSSRKVMRGENKPSSPFKSRQIPKDEEYYSLTSKPCQQISRNEQKSPPLSISSYYKFAASEKPPSPPNSRRWSSFDEVNPLPESKSRQSLLHAENITSLTSQYHQQIPNDDKNANKSQRRDLYNRESCSTKKQYNDINMESMRESLRGDEDALKLLLKLSGDTLEEINSDKKNPKRRGANSVELGNQGARLHHHILTMKTTDNTSKSHKNSFDLRRTTEMVGREELDCTIKRHPFINLMNIFRRKNTKVDKSAAICNKTK